MSSSESAPAPETSATSALPALGAAAVTAVPALAVLVPALVPSPLLAPALTGCVGVLGTVAGPTGGAAGRGEDGHPGPSERVISVSRKSSSVETSLCRPWSTPREGR